MASLREELQSLAGTGQTLSDLFVAEPDRLSRLTIEEAGIHFDFSKTHLSAAMVDGLAALADAHGFKQSRDALFNGEIVNVT
jgi:glucose-6-phosphate isomerase